MNATSVKHQLQRCVRDSCPASRRPATIAVMVNDGRASDAARGARIRSLREAKGWSMQDLANRVGADKSSVQRWEKGATFRVDYLMLLMAELETSAGFILTGEQSEGESAGASPSRGFVEFLSWLQDSRMAEMTEPWMLRELERINPPEVDLPAESYRQMLIHMLSIEGEV